ncbi:MAG: copper amine oxidase N-terminal domain-containing protein [Clostridiales Family XIII bacterium]|nr:copper amine oxidase N-terminal domain-containing protein [Clostridiales Family XIII bacterium]
MKKKMINLSLALLLCAVLTVPAFAALPSHDISENMLSDPYDDDVQPFMNITNFTSEDVFEDTDWGEVHIIHAVAPATVTVLRDSYTWDNGAVGDIGGEIHKVDMTEDKKISEDWFKGEKIPLATGQTYQLEGSFANVVPAGSTFVLGEGEYYLPSPMGGIPIFIVVAGDSAGTAPSTPATLTAKPTASIVLVNGREVGFNAYNIGGNNYFKLRDIAFALTAYIPGTSEKRFDVGWDSSKNAISLTGGVPYTTVGGEMEAKGSGIKTPAATSSKVYLAGNEVNFAAYNIDGNNYFKLRDIGAAFDFGVTWDGAKNTIVIDTNTGYTPE